MQLDLISSVILIKYPIKIPQCFKVGDHGEIDVAVIHKHFLENFGADVKLKDVFDEDSQYDIGEIAIT